MRIKWTSIPSVMARNTAAPTVGVGLAERAKPGPMNERELTKKEDKKKTEGSLSWLRRSR
jgi:hypothetical protein